MNLCLLTIAHNPSLQIYKVQGIKINSICLQKYVLTHIEWNHIFPFI